MLFFLVLGIISLVDSKLYAQNDVTYFQKYKASSDSLSLIYGIPSCVILGVAYHESAGGTSVVATKLNNHFGIAGNCREDVTHHKSRYRYYATVLDSYNSFCEMVACKKFFDSMQGITDERIWLQKIFSSGYASDKKWAQRILKIIDTYCIK
jgi:flagellum-specific peptidoglycan hydrolase FlgJ